MKTPLTRRDFLRFGAGATAWACGVKAEAAPSAQPGIARSRIPSSGAEVARVGLGTWQTFDVGDDAAKRAQLAGVLQVFAQMGGDLVDTSPMYGTAESVLGDLAAGAGLRERLFFATKVWTTGERSGVRQMEDSLRKLRTDRVELMQIHNLTDWRTHLKTLRAWKERGRFRHIGITHYVSSAYPDVARILRDEPLDFVQLNLSLDEPEAAGAVLALCAERGVAFIANRPFGGGGAFTRTRGRELPGWAKETGINSWAQFLIKWVLSHPEVTCAIPGTSRPEHMRDNLQAAIGPPPGAALREKMAVLWREL
jgi:diketogulonate reductase-like aldo/keto reductase